MDLRPELLQELSFVQGTGAFCAQGQEAAPLVPLSVAGVGRIAWPLLPVQAEALRAVAEAAPYGRGAETLVDASVRRSWQIEPSRLKLGGDGYWEDALAGIVEAAQEGLGVEGEVKAELYKLLLYEEGGFFLAHRDSEKAPGMFGTLVIVLPSDFEGGELVVRHQGEEVVAPLKSEHQAELSWAAFFTDCLHELRPITSGHRIALIYNLVKRGGTLRRSPTPELARASVAKVLRRWDAKSPDKLVLLLEHGYSQAALGWDALKGRDAGVALVVREAAARAGCTVQLAQLSVSEVADASPRYYGSRRWRRGGADADEDYEVGEVLDRSYKLTAWHALAGELAWPGDMALETDEDEIAPEEVIEDLVFDEEIFTEATGNAGATVERSYLRAALVIWPDARKVELLRSLNLHQLWELVEARLGAWEQDAPGRADHPARLDAIQAAEIALEKESSRGWRATSAESWRLLGRLGEQRLLLLGLAVLWDRFLDAEAVKALTDAIQRAQPPLWAAASAAAAQQLPPAPALENVAALLPLLQRLPAGGSRDKLADALLAGLRRVPVKSLDPPLVLPTRRTPAHDPRPKLQDDLWGLLAGIAAIDSDLAAQAASVMLATTGALWETLWLQLLTAGRFASYHQKPSLQATRRALLAGVLPRLRDRLAAPLEPPRDFALSPLRAPCCKLCQELSAFLVSPDQAAWSRLGLVREHNHLMEQLVPYGLNTAAETVKEKTRYRLVVTKTHGVYKARCTQREQDRLLEAELRALQPEEAP